jgi:anti-sigma factor RsiW
MTCRELTDYLDRYLAGDLAGAERARLDEHLALCPDCVAYLATYRETIRAGKAACADPDQAVGGEVPEELLQAILAARRASA